MLLFTPCLEKAFAEAKRRRLFMGPKRVAIDIHEKPFYGEADGTIRGRARYFFYTRCPFLTRRPEYFQILLILSSWQ